MYFLKIQDTDQTLDSGLSGGNFPPVSDLRAMGIFPETIVPDNSLSLENGKRYEVAK